MAVSPPTEGVPPSDLTKGGMLMNVTDFVAIISFMLTCILAGFTAGYAVGKFTGTQK